VVCSEKPREAAAVSKLGTSSIFDRPPVSAPALARFWFAINLPRAVSKPGAVYTFAGPPVSVSLA
jgi:hypothetical protein